MDYQKIVTKAIRATIGYPQLWLLGVFLAVGFNAHLIWPEDLLSLFWGFSHKRNEFGFGFSGHFMSPTFFALLIWVLSIWAKVSVVEKLKEILKVDVEDNKREVNVPEVNFSEGASHKFLFSTTQIALVGLFTTFMTLLVLLALNIPFLSFARDESWVSLMRFSAFILFGLFIFVISIVAVFSCFYILLFGFKAESAINLSVQLLAKKWQYIAGSVFLVCVLYLSAYFVGIFFLSLCIKLAGVFGVSLAEVAKNMLLWGWMSVLNVFFYACMLLLFQEWVKLEKIDAAEKELALAGLSSS